MTLRQLVRNFLSGKDYVLSREIHEYLCSGGFPRTSTEPMLSRMRRSGELLSEGVGRNTKYKLNTDFQAGAKPEKRPEKKVSKGPMQKAELETNGVFDAYRCGSQIYQLDRMLREVRNAATSGQR